MRNNNWRVEFALGHTVGHYVTNSEDDARSYYVKSKVGGSIITIKLFDPQNRLIAAKSQFEKANHEERKPDMPIVHNDTPHLKLAFDHPFEDGAQYFQLYSHAPNRFLNVFTRTRDSEQRIGTLRPAQLRELRDYLNTLDLPPQPPMWSGEEVTTIERVIELADEVGDGGGEDFLAFVREFRKWHLTQQ